MYKEIYFKALAHAIVGPASVTSAGQQATKLEPQAAADAAASRQNFFPGKHQFLLLRPFN